MSIPQNPLDKFRSFSYHHILLVANSTEALRAFTEPSSEKNEGDLLANLALGKKMNVEGVANAGIFLLCDSRKSSHFSINDVQYDSSIRVGKNTYSNYISSTLKISLTDAYGIAFVNYLDYIKEQFQVSIHKCVFLLKTIFVGHTDSGTTETIYQAAIPMMLLKTNVAPSHLGGMVDLDMRPLSQGAVINIGDWDAMYDIPGIYSETKKLKDSIKSLETTLNSKARQWYKELQVKRSDSEAGASSGADSFGKLVQYMITIPEHWNNFEVIGVFNQATESKFKKGGYKDPISTSGVFIGFNTTPETSIVDVIKTVLKHSKDVQKLASDENRQNGKVMEYEILTTITSDDETFTIHFDIVNYVFPKITDEEKQQSESLSKTVPFNLDKERNLLEFDYIFTGKNTDIINFNMQINNVNQYLADDVYIGDKSTQEAAKNQTEKSTDDTPTVKKEAILNVSPKDPILPPIKSGSQQFNMPWITETDGKNDYVKARQQFISNMARAHGQSSLDIILKIRGNSSLYGRLTNDKLFPHVKIIDNTKSAYVTSSQQFLDGQNGEYLSQTDIKNYVTSLNELVKDKGVQMAYEQNNISTLLPFYIKINIKGQLPDPSNFDAFDPSTAPYENILFSGYYQVKKVSHKFSNGEFYQELLISALVADLY